jgi:predicted RNA binding protein YcfA (HicA-like mRNA interferase family)
MSSPLRQQHVRAAAREGWAASLTKGSHVRLIHRATGVVVFCSGTPSDRRVPVKLAADLRRALRRQEAGR